MDKIIFNGIDKFGFTVIFALIVMYALYKLWNIFYKNLSDRIGRLEKVNDEFREENKYSKELLNKAFDSFNETIKEFRNINKKVDGLGQDIKDIKQNLIK